MLSVCEIFKSIQGESTFAGKICSFVRLAGCNLQCRYCDTKYALKPGINLSAERIVKEVLSFDTTIVEITGGEPLFQEETPLLCEMLDSYGKTVLIETNGSLDISVLHKRIIRIIDIKCPSSGMTDYFRYSNLSYLRPMDQLKFVIADRRDFKWACKFVKKHKLQQRCIVIFSPVVPDLEFKDLAEWILNSDLDIRLGLQLHKIIWGPEARGV